MEQEGLEQKGGRALEGPKFVRTGPTNTGGYGGRWALCWALLGGHSLPQSATTPSSHPSEQVRKLRRREVKGRGGDSEMQVRNGTETFFSGVAVAAGSV